MSVSFSNYKTPFKPNTVLCERYRLEEIVGYGRMGGVWKAEDTQEGTEVGIKFVPRDIQQYRNEMHRVKESFTSAHMLKHPSICPFLSMERDAKYGYFLVTRWLPGPMLDTFLAGLTADEKLPQETILNILKPLASALDYSHGQMVIHRDVKLSNIALELAPDGRKVLNTYLLDFALAYDLSESSALLSRVNSSSSSAPIYLSPEQWLNGRQGVETDQYSLGVIAYELYSGSYPFPAPNIETLRNAVLNSTPEPIPNLPAHIRWALKKVLAKKMKKRFASCSEFVRALSEPMYRFKRPRFLLSALVIILLIVGVLAGLAFLK